MAPAIGLHSGVPPAPRHRHDARAGRPSINQRRNSEQSSLSTRSTRVLVAMRPFSLIVAVATCGLGIVLALGDGVGSAIVAAAILVAGLLLQVGVNLINDHADLDKLPHSLEEQCAIRRNARLGGGAIAVACVVGLGLVALRGPELLLIGLVGVFGLWAYAADPVNLKARGLGLPAVFLLTGVLMVAGAYLAMGGSVTPRVVAWSLPFSFFAALLLIANELRDYESDVTDGHGTFTVRFGHARGASLFRLLAVLIGVSTLVLAFAERAPLLALTVPLLVLLPWRDLDSGPAQRVGLARMTGRCYALYSLVFLAVVWISQP